MPAQTDAHLSRVVAARDSRCFQIDAAQSSSAPIALGFAAAIGATPQCAERERWHAAA